jgi:hypothetical protein
VVSQRVVSLGQWETAAEASGSVERLCENGIGNENESCEAMISHEILIVLLYLQRTVGMTYERHREIKSSTEQ